MTKLKSFRLHMIARIIRITALIACLGGIAVYSILCLPEMLNIKFEWLYIIMTGAGAAVMVLISVLFDVCAIRCKEGSKELAGEVAEAGEEPVAETESDEVPEAEVLTEEVGEETEPDTESNELEAPAELELECADVQEQKKPTKVQIVLAKVKERIPPEVMKKVDRTTEVVKKNARIIVPVAVACVTAVVAKKTIDAKTREKNRKQFYKWLG